MNAFGIGSAFLSSVTWAVGTAGYSRLSRTHSPFTVNFSRALFALPLFVAAAFLGGWTHGLAEFSQLRAANVEWLALSMLCSYGFGDVLFLWSTQGLGVPGALAIASSYPLWTALAGVLYLGERLTLQQGAGLVVAVGGIVTVILNGPKGEPRASAKQPPLRSRLAQQKGVALAFAASILWAVNSVAVARGGQGVTMPVGNAVRMAFGLAYCAVIGRFVFGVRRLALPGAELRGSIWIFIVEAFGGSAFFVYGLAHSPLAIGVTLSSLAPVLSVPVALALRLEKFSPARTLGVCMTVAGLALLLYV